MAEIILLIFPIILSLAGGYLLYRGAVRKLQKRDAISGAVAEAEPLLSHISAQRCAYSKVVVEYYQRGANPWKEIYSFESKVPFKIGAKTVDPTHASFSLPVPKRFEGYIRPNPGLFDMIGPGIRQLRGMADITSEISPGEVLDGHALNIVLSLPGAKERMKNYMKGAIRVTEHCLPLGTEVTVAIDPAAPQGSANRISGTLEYPLVISVHGAHSIMDEKALMSMGLGAFLVLLALSVIVLMVF
ncbi:MAG: hypothetical protein V1861_02935 [Candidatus Micrarchaeota archaeon]